MYIENNGGRAEEIAVQVALEEAELSSSSSSSSCSSTSFALRKLSLAWKRVRRGKREKWSFIHFIRQKDGRMDGMRSWFNLSSRSFLHPFWLSFSLYFIRETSFILVWVRASCHLFSAGEVSVHPSVHRYSTFTLITSRPSQFSPIFLVTSRPAKQKYPFLG